jgi:ADP-heptose:LPS heptosyltransferase
MVTNDSGPAHFASLLRLPTVVLFGPETPRLYSPLGDKHKDMYSHFACSPCVSVYNGKKSPCRENRCLMAITPEAVLEEVLLSLSDTVIVTGGLNTKIFPLIETKTGRETEAVAT